MKNPTRDDVRRIRRKLDAMKGSTIEELAAYLKSPEVQKLNQGMKNPILAEVRRNRLQIAAETGNTVEGLRAYLESPEVEKLMKGMKISDRKPVKLKRRRKVA